MTDQSTFPKNILSSGILLFFLFSLLFFLFTCFPENTSAQGAGSLDPTFNGTGYVVYDRDQTDLYQDVKVQPDGKIVAAGTSYTPTYSSVIEVTRYLDDGSFDPSFGTSGHFNYGVNIETGAYKCIIRDNGKILVGGYTTDYTSWWMLLLQINPDGTPDSTFGVNGVTTINAGPGEDVIYALALLNDGRILAAGYSQDVSFLNVPFVARFSVNGILDTSFGTAAFAKVPVTESDNDFSAICVQPDGKILAAGHISNGLNWFSLLIARFDSTGMPDPSYGTDGVVNLNLGNVDDEFFDIQLTSQDEAILTGFTVTQEDFYYHLLLMKFDASGQPEPSFGNNGSVIAGEVPYTFGDALALETDGRILVTGCTGNLAPDNNDWALWRFQSDGSPDSIFGTNGLTTTDFFGNADESLGIALYQDKIILAGKTRNADNFLDFAVARYTNDVGVTVPLAEKSGNVTVSPNPAGTGSTVNVTLNTGEGAGRITIDLLNTISSTIATYNMDVTVPGRQTIQITLQPGVASGLYFLRISNADGFSATKKLVVR
jgi:uncharacterized delta-60 repeat protein